MKSQPPRKRVLFVCYGNSCRSQMAEGFAKTYGSDVMKAASAGLAPAPVVADGTIRTMAEKNIDVSAHEPKSLAEVSGSDFDLVINMSGLGLPNGMPMEVRTWNVRDPIGCSDTVYGDVRDQIENMVMKLILELRRAGKKQPPA